MMRMVPVSAAVNVIREGVYKPADFDISKDKIYAVQNVSPDQGVYILVFDENQIVVQSIRLGPKSEKTNLVLLKPDYRVVVVGKGEVYIS